jgi:hypothetical protein
MNDHMLIYVLIYVLFWTEGQSMKKRHQGDDENKKEEIVMITLKRRRTLTPLIIHDEVQKFRSIGKSRQK